MASLQPLVTFCQATWEFAKGAGKSEFDPQTAGSQTNEIILWKYF